MPTLIERSRDLREKRLGLLQERARRRERKRLEQSLAAFVRAAWHVVEPACTLDWSPHLDAMCLHLEAVTSGKIQNLAITIPPGCTKSITVSVMWPAWMWTTKPGLRYLCAANDIGISIRDSVACRRLIDSEWFQERWSDVFQLTTDQNVKGWYENTRRGHRISTSVGGSIVGKKGDILLGDDLDDAKKVLSETERHNVHTWWDHGFFNRVNNHVTGRRVVIGQRTHDEDTIGHWLQTGDVVELRIPEEFEPEHACETPIGWCDWRTEAGELLRPARFGPKQIDEAKKRLGTMGYAAQHQQRPRSKDGYRFKEHWFGHYRWKADYAILDDGYYFIPNEWMRFATVDPAASEKTTADWTVISSWAVSPRFERDLLWLGCIRLQHEIQEIIPFIEEEWLKWHLEYVAIEAVAANDAVYKLARRTKMDVRALSTQSKDKLVRAHPAIVLAEGGRIFVPDNDPAFPTAIIMEELTSFSGIKGQDKHDDIVDTLSYAVHLRDGRASESQQEDIPFVYSSR